MSFGAEVERIRTEVSVNMNMNVSGRADGPFRDPALAPEQEVQAIFTPFKSFTQPRSAFIRFNFTVSPSLSQFCVFSI